MKPSRRPWLAEWMFGLALLAYPRAFRRRFGDEMRDDFRRAAGHRMTAGMLVTLIREGLNERVGAVARWSFWPNHQPHLYEPSGRHAMFWDSVRADVRYTIRQAIQAPLYTVLAVGALALGIGANSAIFTVVQGVLLKPLPYDDPDRLVTIWSHNTAENRPENPISPANFVDLRDEARSFATLEGYFSFVTNTQIVLDGPPEISVTSYVSPGMFTLLGRTAMLGRALREGDADGDIVISHGYWQRRFGGDPAVINRQVTLDGQPATIVGVMPPDFSFPYRGMLGPTGFTRSIDVDAWVTMLLTGPRMVDASGRFVRNVHYLGAVGRLKPGVGVEQARAGVAAIASRLEQAYPETNKGWTTTVTALHEQVVGAVRPALLVLAAGVGVILLMACVNVANLVLARSVSRQKELAVRAALGAGRKRLAQQALTESLLLAVAGGIAGLLVVRWGVQALVALAPANLPRLQEVAPDTTVLLITLAMALLTGTLVGVVPAFFATRADLRPALQESSRGSVGSRSRHRVRAALVVAELALAVVLSVGAGLLLRSFATVMTIDPGFRPDHLLTLQMSIPYRLTTPEARRAYYAEWFERLEAIPGVEAVGGTTRIPLGSTSVTTSVQVQGKDVPASDLPEVEFRRAMHDYFEAMGIPVKRGRGFSAEDGPNAPPVVIVNEATVRRVFGNEDPIGQHVRTGPNPSGPWSTVIGVIGDIRHAGLETAPSPELYVNYLQNPPVAPFIALRTAGDPAALAERVRTEARAFDSTLAIYDIRTMQQIRAASVAERRFLLLLIGAFGALALVLAAVGVYGVMALVVSERTQEMGVRLALGAAPVSVLSMIVRQAATLAAIGVAAGVLAAIGLTPLLTSQLFGVRALDPITFAAVAALLASIATVAALVPARRAMQVDPLAALRVE
ncbi:MAG: ABC transporter permease [Vicinamibacterales bacterium]